MKTLLNNWSVFRTIRLLIGIAVVVKGAIDGEVFFALAGGLVALMALANIGCCGSGGCAIPNSSPKADLNKQNNVSYEEVVNSK